MNRAVYALASGGIAAQARLDAVTQNLANVGTAGYKAGRPVFRLRPLDVEEAGLPVPPALRAAAQVTEAETVRDFSQGPVHATGNPLDVAVTGEGFFVVATPRGERYTRQGGFGLEHGDGRDHVDQLERLARIDTVVPVRGLLEPQRDRRDRRRHRERRQVEHEVVPVLGGAPAGEVVLVAHVVAAAVVVPP